MKSTRNLVQQSDAATTMDSLDDKSMAILVIVLAVLQIGFDAATAITLPDHSDKCLEGARTDITWFFFIKVLVMTILTALLILLKISCCRSCKYFLDITWFICVSFGFLNIIPLINCFSCGYTLVNATYQIILIITTILLSLFMALIYWSARPTENKSQIDRLDAKTLSTLAVTFFIILIVFDAFIITMPDQLGKCLEAIREDIVLFSRVKLVVMGIIAVILIVLQFFRCRNCTYLYDIAWFICVVSGVLNVFPLICFFACENFPVDSKFQFVLTLSCIALGVFIAFIYCCYKRSPTSDIGSQDTEAQRRISNVSPNLPLIHRLNVT